MGCANALLNACIPPGWRLYSDKPALHQTLGPCPPGAPHTPGEARWCGTHLQHQGAGRQGLPTGGQRVHACPHLPVDSSSGQERTRLSFCPEKQTALTAVLAGLHQGRRNVAAGRRQQQELALHLACGGSGQGRGAPLTGLERARVGRAFCSKRLQGGAQLVWQPAVPSHST